MNKTPLLTTIPDGKPPDVALYTVVAYHSVQKFWAMPPKPRRYSLPQICTRGGDEERRTAAYVAAMAEGLSPVWTNRHVVRIELP